MNDDLLALPDLTPHQKIGMTALKMLFWAAILSSVCLGALTCYYGITCPTIAKVESGHTYPFYDKIYGRYVFVTEAERDAMPILVCFGAACVFTGVAIDLDLKRQVRASRKN